MERLISFSFDNTCYFVARPREWAFFLRVSDAGAAGIHYNLDLPHPAAPTRVLTPRQFTYPVGEGMCLEMTRLDGSEEDVTIWAERADRAGALIGVELPDGVAIELFDADGDEPSGP